MGYRPHVDDANRVAGQHADAACQGQAMRQPCEARIGWCCEHGWFSAILPVQGLAKSASVSIAASQDDGIQRVTSRTALASALALALLLNTGCAGTDEANISPPHPADVLVGCYAQENGDEPDLQVSGADGSYRLGKAGSSRPDEEALILSALKEHEWMQLPTDVAGQLEALIRDDMGVILLMKFRPDAVIDGKAPPSPFHFVAPRIGGALTRVPCPAS